MSNAACTCQPSGGLPHGEAPYDYGYDDPSDCPVHAKSAAQARERPDTLAVCGFCNAPLIGTFHWRGKEWVCIECGRLYEFFGCASANTTDKRWERYEALHAEWMEHAGPKLLTPGARHEGCPKCWGEGSEDHDRHATDEERAAHEEAMAWLKARTK